MEQHVRQFLSVNQLMETETKNPNVDTSVLSVEDVTSSWRRELWERSYHIVPGYNLLEKKRFEKYYQDSDEVFEVILSCHPNEQCFAIFFRDKLQQHLPHVRISISKANVLRLHLLDDAKVVIPFLSDNFIEDSGLMEELDTALFRHRVANSLILCPIIVGDLPLLPSYIRLLFCLFSCHDSFWYPPSQACEATRSNLPEEMEPHASICLTTASLFVANIVAKQPTVSTSFKTLLSMHELQKWYHGYRCQGDDFSPDFTPTQFEI